MKLVLALLASLAAVPAVLSETDVVLTDGSCKSPWDVTVSSTCGDDACTTIEVSSEFDPYTLATATVFYYTVAQQEVNICDYIEPLDGQECGTAGTYKYSGDTSMTIPYDNVSSYLSYMPVKVTMQDITTCTIYMKPVESSSSMGMAAAVLAGALVVAGIVSVRRRRRRRVENESLRWTLTDFEMPPEGIRNGVHV